MVSCCAIGCSNRSDRKKEGEKRVGLTFRRFPFRNPVLLKKWLSALHRKNFHPTKTSVLCSDHFEEKCFDRTGQTTRLRDNAIPTIFNFSTPIRLTKRGQKKKELEEVWLYQSLGRKRKCKSAYRRGAEEDSVEHTRKSDCIETKDPPMVLSCCAIGCRERYVKGGPLTFHRFPRNPKWRGDWTKAMKRKNFSPTIHSRVCSKHFTADSFIGHSGQGVVLRKDAVPTIFNFRGQKKKSKKIYASSSEESDVPNNEDECTAPEEIPLEIKEEPLDLDGGRVSVDPLLSGDKQGHAVWLPPSMLLEPVVCLPRLPLTNVSNVVSEAPTQKIVWIPESGAAGCSITLNNAHLEDGVRVVVQSHSVTAVPSSKEEKKPHPMLQIVPNLLTLSNDKSSFSEMQITSNTVPSKTKVCSFTNTSIQNSKVSPHIRSPTIVPGLPIGNPVKKVKTVKIKEKALPLSTVEPTDEDQDLMTGADPPINMVFVKVVEDWDDQDENAEPKLCIIETTSMDDEVDETTKGVTSWIMKSKPAEVGQVSRGEEDGTKEESASGQMSSVPSDTKDVEGLEVDCVDEDSDGESMDTEVISPSKEAESVGMDVFSLPESANETTEEPSNSAIPSLVLVGPLSLSEKKLADLHSKLFQERAKNLMLQKRFNRERTQKTELRHKVKILQQKLRRLQNKLMSFHLGKGMTVPNVQPSGQGGDREEDFTWNEV